MTGSTFADHGIFKELISTPVEKQLMVFRMPQDPCIGLEKVPTLIFEI